MEVDLDALVRNARRLGGGAPSTTLLPMVKADAYGLGAVRVARALSRLNPYGFGVASAEEARELREAGIDGRVVVFFPWVEAETAAMLELGLDAAVLGIDSLERLDAALGRDGGRLDIHLEIDTGIGRAGLDASAARTWAPRVGEVLGQGRLRLASVFTHFFSGEDAEASRSQLERFERALAALRHAGVEPPLTHVANSDAAMSDPQYHSALVRPGIYLYGGRRGTDIPAAVEDPESVVRVRARALEVRELPAGATVGYGATYATRAKERIATLGIGYANGVPWRLSNRGQVIVGGVRAPIRGSVCMDVVAVDVSGVPGVEAGTIVTALGREGDEEIELREWAEGSGTIEYDVLTGLGRGLKKVYLEAEET